MPHPGLRRAALVPTLLFFVGTALSAQEPPAQAPDHWSPVSINLEDVPYPHPISYVEFDLYGERVRMAFMDVRPQGGRDEGVVVFLHGGNYWAAS